jgi:hypothetical protein
LCRDATPCLPGEMTLDALLLSLFFFSASGGRSGLDEVGWVLDLSEEAAAAAAAADAAAATRCLWRVARMIK